MKFKNAVKNNLLDYKKSLSKPDYYYKANSALLFIILIALFLSVIIWQLSFAVQQSPELIDKYKKTGILHSCGVSFSDPEHVFTYGLYYWGLFPVFPDRELLPSEFQDDSLFFSKEGAKKIMDVYGNTLRMDIAATFRMGNVFSLWIPYFVAIFRGSIIDTSFIPFNGFFFVMSLLLLLGVFWVYNRGILGVLLVLILGSYPFQIYSVYFQDNIFSYMISSMIMLSAVLFPMIFDIKFKTSMLFVIVSAAGMISAFAYMLRADCLTVFFPTLLVILLYRRRNLRARLMLLLVFLFFFHGTASMANTFFKYKFNQAKKVVENKGGAPFEGHKMQAHLFWHTIWCGMCDFDDTYKHSWSDYVAEYRVKPILNKIFGRNYGRLPYHHSPVDYYLPAFEPDYDKAMKILVIKDIKESPGWYAGILVKRLDKILFHGLRPRIALSPDKTLFIPGNMVFYLFFFLLLVFIKEWGYVKLIVFSAGTIIVPLFVTTFTNYHHYFIAPMFSAAVFYYSLWKFAEYKAMKKYLTRKAAHAG